VFVILGAIDHLAYNQSMSVTEDHIGRLFAAELQFRLASAVRLAVTAGDQPLDLPILWSHGRHVVGHKEVALRADQADFAAEGLQRTATFLMAVVIRDAIVATVPKPKDDPRPDVRSAYQISRLIRNAFAHGPIVPNWSIDADCRDKKFAVGEIIVLDTTDLHSKPFDWRHYGGPLALLKLCQFTRFQILGDIGRKPSDREIDLPKVTYYQQGSLVLRKLDN
jgi:hypothetical protein